MATIYLSAGMNRFTYSGTEIIPISSFRENIVSVREQKRNPINGSVFYWSYIPEYLTQKLTFLSPGEVYFIYAKNGFEIVYS